MTARLAGKLGWTINAAGGAILRLRCWCIEFAPDGDLSPFAPAEIAVALGEPPAKGPRIVDAMIESRWLEATPYFRVASWWQTAGLFLRGRFKREPAVWQRIERLYVPDAEDSSDEGSDLSADESESCSEPAPELLRSSRGAENGRRMPILS